MDRNTLLVRQYKTGDEKALETLLKENERLIWSIVGRMPSAGWEKEDLFQTGCIGLIKAAQRFDTERGIMFSTYAVHMIMGEIKRFLRDDGTVKVSRNLKELAVKVRKISDEISAVEKREATITEIAGKLGKKEEEIAECLEADKKPLSINQPIGEEGQSLEEIIAGDSDFDEKTAEILSVAEAAKKLSDREKYILMMRYYKNKTQAQIAEKLGVSQVHVSRLEKKIIDSLRREIV